MTNTVGKQLPRPSGRGKYNNDRALAKTPLPTRNIKDSLEISTFCINLVMAYRLIGFAQLRK